MQNDVARRRALDSVAASFARVVVVTEGLLVYLDAGLVGALADDLRARTPMRKWVLESVSPEVVKRNMRAWGKVLAQGNAEWKFAPANGFEFFDRHGWSLTVRRPFFAEARRLRRDTELRSVWLVRVLSSLSERFRSRLENLVVYGVVEPK